MALADRIKDARNRAGMSQQVLATTAGIASGTLVRIEAGHNAQLETIAALADALGTTVAELVS